MNPEIDNFFNRAKKWHEEMEQLRMICLDCGLTEALKWGKPCYAFQKNNIAIIQPFKKSCALMFFKGVLLGDSHDMLEKPGKNSRIARRIRFTGIQEVVEKKLILKAYIYEAIEIEEAGLEVDMEEKKEPVPKELQAKLDENPDLQTAFESLTPGRQRGYLLYFSGAKKSETRQRRVEKYIPKIFKRKGLNDT